MARMSISLRDDLKARMDAAGDQNWSAVAQRAFTEEIQRLEWRRKQIEEISMEDVAERLRESKSAAMEKHHDDGFAEGVVWAKRAADYAELETVAEWDAGDWEEADEEALAWDFARELIGEDNFGGRNDVNDFWERIDADRWRRDTPSNGYVAGFAEGAVSVWEEVKDNI